MARASSKVPTAAAYTVYCEDFEAFVELTIIAWRRMCIATLQLTYVFLSSTTNPCHAGTSSFLIQDAIWCCKIICKVNELDLIWRDIACSVALCEIQDKDYVSSYLCKIVGQTPLISRDKSASWVQRVDRATSKNKISRQPCVRKVAIMMIKFKQSDSRIILDCIAKSSYFQASYSIDNEPF